MATQTRRVSDEERDEMTEQYPIRRGRHDPTCPAANCGRAIDHDGVHASYQGTWSNPEGIRIKAYWVRDL